MPVAFVLTGAIQVLCFKILYIHYMNDITTDALTFTADIAQFRHEQTDNG
jgi:hypothetical protein